MATGAGRRTVDLLCARRLARFQMGTRSGDVPTVGELLSEHLQLLALGSLDGAKVIELIPLDVSLDAERDQRAQLAWREGIKLDRGSAIEPTVGVTVAGTLRRPSRQMPVFDLIFIDRDPLEHEHVLLEALAMLLLMCSPDGSKSPK
jgi:hypothetical protein